ncbi:35288_t:CDS:2, partial [Racocetra persica]
MDNNVFDKTIVVKSEKRVSFDILILTKIAYQESRDTLNKTTKKDSLFQ